ncbi:MAG: PTS sugar transporter subunit IIA [Planctomycetes bacterium]|nr:PTS sugar transporter subunit IIA [Planctomycetota bacterium]
MLIAQHLRHDRIRLEMLTQPLSEEEREVLGGRAQRELKERILAEVAGFLEERARVGNRKRLLTDLINRERKACTAVGKGLAIPHVRTMNVKEPTIALLRSTGGLDFAAPDGALVHIFLVLLAPPYDDKLYLKVYREVAQLFLHEGVLPFLLAARAENDIFQFFRTPERFISEL